MLYVCHLYQKEYTAGDQSTFKHSNDAETDTAVQYQYQQTKRESSSSRPGGLAFDWTVISAYNIIISIIIIILVVVSFII